MGNEYRPKGCDALQLGVEQASFILFVDKRGWQVKPCDSHTCDVHECIKGE